jgi:glycosyltransferase involved in cell wall biosynthesis
MNIGIDTRLTCYRLGGISTYMRQLVQALENLDIENCYTVFQSRKANEALVKRFRSTKLWTPCHHRWERLALSVELARFNLHVFHSPDFIPPLHGAKRHIITVHDLTFLRYPQYLTSAARRYYNGHIEQAVRQADHILADSSSTKEDLVIMLNVPPEKITVHMLGVDARFRPIPESLLAVWAKQLRLPQNYILFVGTLEPRKNIAGMLEAYRILIGRLPDVPHLLLVGKGGWLFEKTLEQVQAMKLGSKVIWRDNIGDDALPAVYNLASLLVVPSFYEGFGLTALEGLACGTIPIVSNRSSLPEVVGDVGLQINPDDPEELAAAMERALTDEGWRTYMRTIGLERARQFTWEKTALIVLSTYRAISKH